MTKTADPLRARIRRLHAKSDANNRTQNPLPDEGGGKSKRRNRKERTLENTENDEIPENDGDGENGENLENDGDGGESETVENPPPEEPPVPREPPAAAGTDPVLSDIENANAAENTPAVDTIENDERRGTINWLFRR